MQESGFSNEGVPLLGATDEVRAVRRECDASNDPFLAVEERDDEYAVVYDMTTTTFDLRESAVQTVTDLFDACPETYHREVGDPPATVPEAFHADETTGEIAPLDGYAAVSLASDLSEVVLDVNNWKAVSERGIDQ